MNERDSRKSIGKVRVMNKNSWNVMVCALKLCLAAALFWGGSHPMVVEAAVLQKSAGAAEMGKQGAEALKQNVWGQVGCAPGTDAEQEQGGIRADQLSFDVSRFVLPSDAKTLVVVEGFAVNGGREVYQRETVEDTALWNRARVTAFVKGANGNWVPRLQSPAVLGWGGMSNKRHSGDGTTPIGLWRADTPFGWAAPEAGFPSEYEQIIPSLRTQYWSDATNRLEHSHVLTAQSGERLWEDWAKELYAYSLNTGFNRNHTHQGAGSALFLHCTKPGKPSTAGCVAMDPSAMRELLKWYAKGALYVAQAPEGQFEAVYGAFSENGDSAPGTFSPSQRQMPDTATILVP